MTEKPIPAMPIPMTKQKNHIPTAAAGRCAPLDPERMAGRQALAADLERLTAYVTASPPATPGGAVLLPGEIERRTRARSAARTGSRSIP